MKDQNSFKNYERVILNFDVKYRKYPKNCQPRSQIVLSSFFEYDIIVGSELSNCILLVFKMTWHHYGEIRLFW